MSWFLQIGDGPAQSFAGLRCVDLKRGQRSQAPGTFTFRLNLQAMETAPIANVNDLAQVFWIEGIETTTFFAGRVTRVPLAGSAQREDQTYEISDAWSDFERITFQQQWNRIVSVDDEGNPTIAGEFSACCLLGVDVNGNPQDSGQVITEAVNWAIARGANCQLGEILVEGTASPVPVDEVTDLPVAEIIKKMIRFTPDAVAWFDYRTTPPKFNVTRRAQCGVATVAFVDQGDLVNITARNDLLRPQVLLRYEQPNVSDGETFTQVSIDAAPDGADGLAFGSLVSTVRLAGGNAAFEKQPVTTAPIPTAGTDSDTVAGWLQRHAPWLAHFTTSRLQVSGFSASVLPDPGPALPANTDGDVTHYPNELLSGSIPNWVISGHGIRTGVVTVQCAVSYRYPEEDDEESNEAFTIWGPDDGPLENWNNSVQFAVPVRGTNAVTTTYSALSSYDEPEAVPTGLAAVLYSALSSLQYEGTWNVIQEEPAPSSALGVVLNITGGRTEWETMNALVQEIQDDLDHGITTYKFGPAGHLTIQDLMEQLRATRKRTLSSKIKERKTGQPSVPQVDGSGINPYNGGGNNAPAPTHYPWIDFIDETDDGDGNPLTYDALLGFGQSSFAGPDGIDQAGPLESLEISVGNDGSAWVDADGAPISEQSSLENALSIISGDQTPAADHLRIARTDGGEGGSLSLNPFDPSLHLSPNLDPDDDDDDTQHIYISLGDMLIEMQDEDGSVISMDLSDSPILKIENADTSSHVYIDENSVTLHNADDSTDGDLESSSLSFTGDGGDGVTLGISDLTFSSSDGGAVLSPGDLELEDSATGGSISLDASETMGKSMYVQEWDVCVDGESQSALFLSSDPY